MSIITDIEELINDPACGDYARERLQKIISPYKAGIAPRHNPFKLGFISEPEADMAGTEQLNMASPDNKDLVGLITWIKINIMAKMGNQPDFRFEFNRKHAVALRETWMITVSVDSEPRNFSFSAVDLFNNNFKSYRSFLNRVVYKYANAPRGTRTGIISSVTKFARDAQFIKEFTLDEMNGTH